MAWKATGEPTVRKQRDKWVVRVDGIDTATGKRRPRQLGTDASQRTANADDSTDLRSARVVHECADSQPRQRSSWSSSAEVDGKHDLGAEETDLVDRSDRFVILRHATDDVGCPASGRSQSLEASDDAAAVARCNGCRSCRLSATQPKENSDG